ncbi:MAG: hypothetical protein E6R11_00085 [Rhodocyclaceae bacterium]|nr:MAG: hypothetical protein E6R11_00085 [Rhodocyclaceae bacterium]
MSNQKTVLEIVADDKTAGGWASAKAVADRHMTDIEGRSRVLSDRVNGAFAAIKGLAVAGAFSEAIGALKSAQVEAQKLAASLNFSSGNRAGEELDYLRNITRQLGVDFGSASSAYASFAASAKGTGISGDTIKATFEGVSKAASQLGLSSDETKGALLALSQMISKGTVQAEELRGQLGERLPGAFNLAAKAMGVTTAELGKLLESGRLTAAEFLPRFAAELNATYQATDNLVAATNRLTSAWDDWKRSLSDGANGSGLSWLTRGLNESSAAMRELGSEAGMVKRILVAIGGFQFGALNAGKFDVAQVRQNLQAEFSRAQDGIAQMEALRKKQGDYLDPFQTQTLGDYRREIGRTRAALDELAVSEGKRNGIKLPNLKDDFAAQQARQQEGLKAYLKDMRLATKDEKTAASVAAENEAFAKATSDFDRKSKAYTDALKIHQARIAEIQKGDKSGAGRTQSIDLNAGLDLEAARSYADAIKSLSEIQATATNSALGLAGSEASLHKIMASPEWARMPEAWRDVIKAQYEAASSAEQLARGEANVREAYNRTIQPLRDRVAELEKENDFYGLTEAQINIVTAARLDEAAAIARANGANEGQLAALERERDLRLDIAKQAGAKDLRDMEHRRIQEEADELKRIGDDVGASLTDAIFHGGRSGWKLLKSTIEATVIRATILPQVQSGVNSVIGAIVGKNAGSSTAGALGGLGSFVKDLFGGSSKAAVSAKSAEDYIDAGGMGQGASSGLLASLFSSLPSFDVGTPYVPRTMFAKVHEGERILTRQENAAGRQSSAPVFNFHFNTNGPIDRRTAQQMARDAAETMQRSLRRNG